MTADPADALGGRLPPADPAAQTGEQLALCDRMILRIVPRADEAGFASTARGGRLIGPFETITLTAHHGAVGSAPLHDTTCRQTETTFRTMALVDPAASSASTRRVRIAGVTARPDKEARS